MLDGMCPVGKKKTTDSDDEGDGENTKKPRKAKKEKQQTGNQEKDAEAAEDEIESGKASVNSLKRRKQKIEKEKKAQEKAAEAETAEAAEAEDGEAYEDDQAMEAMCFLMDLDAPATMDYVIPVRLYGDGADAFSSLAVAAKNRMRKSPDLVLLPEVELEKCELVQNAAEWIQIHGATPWTQMPAFDPWRIYPDVLHVLDLAISPDSIASFLLFATASGNRDHALTKIRQRYFEWASDMKLDAGYLANPKLFTQKILQSSSTSYPAVSQKFLKGAAARMMCYFICGMACEKASESDDLVDKFLC
eukprot:s308_g22.t1